MSTIDRAYRLVEEGRPAEAASLLEKAGQSGDPDAWVELAVWQLGGQYVPRDLARSRESFGKAAELGHGQAQTIHLNLLGSGVGGPRDWAGALARLTALAGAEQDAARQLALLQAMDLNETGDPRRTPASERLSNRPEVVRFPGLLTAGECRYLIDKAMPGLTPSVVVDPASGRMIPHPVRTSENAAFSWVDENPVIHAINRRIAAASSTEASWGEPLQVLRYRPGQQYKPHHDAIAGTDNQRIVTVLLYLNEGYGGGETEFLHTGLRVAGRTGDGLLFRNADATGAPDPTALHAGRPVTAGEKLLATRWIHQRRFGPL
jgi:prolyl 4-hydroxylase